MRLVLLLFLLTVPSVLATGIHNVPSLAERDMVIHDGLSKEYSFPIFGAYQLRASLTVPPELNEYITLYDSAPMTGPRTVRVGIDIPNDAEIPPGIYTVWFSAHEISQGGAQVVATVTAQIGFILRAYSDEPLLQISHVTIPPVPEGKRGNFSANIISRTRATIPSVAFTIEALDQQGAVVATGQANHGVLNSAESITMTGTLPTDALPGGIYKTRARAKYSGGTATYDEAILRVGTLTIDVIDYTKTLTFNQTNKFNFRLKSNWNKPLTNVLTTIDLIGQQKRAPPESIPAFGETGQAEVYFDRTEDPPGPVEGLLTVTYQELAENPAQQEQVAVREFSIPLHVDIAMPLQPAKIEQPFELKPLHILSSVALLLLLLNIIVLWLVLRKKRKKPEERDLPPV